MATAGDWLLALGLALLIARIWKPDPMKYPETVRLRDRIARATRKQASQDAGDCQQGDKPDSAPSDLANDIAKGTPIHVAALRRIATHCGTCGVIFLISLAWMLGLVPRFDSPFARADEVQKIKGMVGEMYARQLSADIRSYQESLCRGRDMFLEGELERAQIAYEKQTGRRYPIVACQQQTQ